MVVTLSLDRTGASACRKNHHFSVEESSFSIEESSFSIEESSFYVVVSDVRDVWPQKIAAASMKATAAEAGTNHVSTCRHLPVPGRVFEI